MPKPPATKTRSDFDRALTYMTSIDPDAVAKCKTVGELNALHRVARGTDIPGFGVVTPLADPNGNGFIQTIHPDGSITHS